MAAPIDLSTLRNKKPTDPGIEGLSPEQQEALERMAEENPGAAGERVETAFLVVLKEGRWLATPDIATPLVLDRQADTDDMREASVKVARDIDISDTAQAVIAMQQQMAYAMAQARQNQQIAQTLKI